MKGRPEMITSCCCFSFCFAAASDVRLDIILVIHDCRLAASVNLTLVTVTVTLP